MRNNTLKNPELQAQFKKDFAHKRKTCHYWKSVDCIPDGEFQKNPELILHTFTPSEKAILNQMIYGAVVYKRHFESKMTIGKRAGQYTTKTAERALKKFQELGLVVRNYRHLKTNEYKLSSWFRHPYNKSRLYSLLKNLQFLPLAILLSTGHQSANSTNVVQKNYGVIYNSLSLNQRTLKESVSTKKILSSQMFKPVLYGDRDGDLKKTSSVMENPIRESIRQIKHVKLTRWGQMMLMPFHDEAIRYADDRMPYAKPSNPFAYFYGLCREYSGRNNLVVDIEVFKVLAHKYNMPEDAKFYFADSMSDNGYYRKDKKPLSTRKSLSKFQSEKNYQQREQGYNSGSLVNQSANNIAQANCFIDARNEQQEKVDAEDKYRAAKTIEQAKHGPLAQYMLVYNSTNPFLCYLDNDQRIKLMKEVHSDCSCPERSTLLPSIDSTRSLQKEIHDANISLFDDQNLAQSNQTSAQANEPDLFPCDLFNGTGALDDWQPIDSIVGFIGDS